MPDSGALTLRFLETHPKAAAKALEDFDIKRAAAFLETVPVRVSAPVFGHATSWIAATWAEHLPAKRAAAVLQQMIYQDAAAVVRQMPEANRQRLLEDLPSNLARNFKRSLTYPGGTVGAWMDQSVPTFNETLTVADGMKFLKSKHGRSSPNLIVVKDGKIFSGIVSATDLLRSPAKTPLSQIMERSLRPLSSSAMLIAVLDVAAWDRYSALPVVSSRGSVLGCLQRSDLKRGLDESGSVAPESHGDSIFAQLLAGYFTALFGLVRLLMDASTAKTSSKRQDA